MAPQQAPLLDLSELEIYGISWAFLDPFVPRPLTISILTGGPLGTMTFGWSLVGNETDTSAPIYSENLPPWSWRISQAFANLTFAVGTYVAGTSYRVDTQGNVTDGAGAIAGVSATRFDLRPPNLQSATDLAVGWMKPKVVPPIISWGTDIKKHVARLFASLLLATRGLAPADANVGDAKVLHDGEQSEKWFRAVGRGEVEPQDLVDSSPDDAGGGLLLYPTSEPPRGW